MKYLYSYRDFINEVYRVKVSRETEKNIWIISGNTEIKIPKKTYRVGKGFYSTLYYEETKELLKEYKKTVLQYKYKEKLTELEKCKDENVMYQVLHINIPQLEIIKNLEEEE